MIDVICARCKRSFEPDHSDYVAGRWRVCPRCRDGPKIIVTPSPVPSEYQKGSSQ